MPSLSIERLPKSRVQCAVSFDREEHTKSQQKALERLGKSRRLKGFRPGKAPLEILKKEIESSEIVNEMLREVLPNIMRQMREKESIQPIMPPDIRVTAEEPLAFTVLILEDPKATVKKPESFTVKTPKEVTVAREDIDQFFRKLLWHDRKESPEEREPRKGDLVLITVLSKDTKGEGIPSLTKHDVRIVIGEGKMPEAIEKALLTMKKGEKNTVALTLPSDAPEAKGKSSKYTAELTLTNVWSVTLPELTQDYLKTHFNIDKSPKEFESEIETMLRDQKQKEVNAQREHEFFTAVRERTVVDLAPELVQHEVESLLENLNADLKERNMTLDQWLQQSNKTPKSLGEELRSAAEERLILRAGIRFLLDKASIKVPEEEVTKAAQREYEAKQREGGAPDYAQYASGGDRYNQIFSEMTIKALLAHYGIS